jgi:hypothetical protein
LIFNKEWAVSSKVGVDNNKAGVDSNSSKDGVPSKDGEGKVKVDLEDKIGAAG